MRFSHFMTFIENFCKHAIISTHYFALLFMFRFIFESFILLLFIENKTRTIIINNYLWVFCFNTSWIQLNLEVWNSCLHVQLFSLSLPQKGKIIFYCSWENPFFNDVALLYDRQASMLLYNNKKLDTQHESIILALTVSIIERMKTQCITRRELVGGTWRKWRNKKK